MRFLQGFAVALVQGDLVAMLEHVEQRLLAGRQHRALRIVGRRAALERHLAAIILVDFDEALDAQRQERRNERQVDALLSRAEAVEMGK